MVQGHVPVFGLMHADDDVAPELRHVQNIGLIDARDAPAAQPGGLKRGAGDALDLRAGVDVGR